MSRKVAFCGIFTALAVVCLYMASLLPTNKIFFTGLSTLFIPLALVAYGKRWALFALAASAALAFAMIPDKLICIAFSALGIYTVLKSYIEQIRRLIFEWAIKLCIYFAAMTAALAVFNVEMMWMKTTVILVGTLVFAVYDVALSAGITYLSDKIKNIVKNH